MGRSQMDSLSSETIMIVDDNKTVRSLLVRLFQPQFHVVEVDTGEACLALMDTLMPDLVILDLALPGLDGIEVCRLLRQYPGGENILILMMTGTRADADKIGTLYAGADGFVEKNALDVAALRKMVRDLIDARLSG